MPARGLYTAKWAEIEKQLVLAELTFYEAHLQDNGIWRGNVVLSFFFLVGFGCILIGAVWLNLNFGKANLFDTCMINTKYYEIFWGGR